MNIGRKVALSGLLALAAIPFAAQADNADRAANACIKSFVETYLPKHQPVRIKKIEPVASPLRYYTNRFGTYTVALSARLSRSGEELAQARCVASARGEVIVMDSPPVATYAANADVAAVIVR